MKRLSLTGLAFLLISASASAADITPSDVMPDELVHEQQAQAQLEALQRERDAAFLKQVEAEALLMAQQPAESSSPPPSSPPAP